MRVTGVEKLRGVCFWYSTLQARNSIASIVSKREAVDCLFLVTFTTFVQFSCWRCCCQDVSLMLVDVEVKVSDVDDVRKSIVRTTETSDSPLLRVSWIRHVLYLVPDVVHKQCQSFKSDGTSITWRCSSDELNNCTTYFRSTKIPRSYSETF